VAGEGELRTIAARNTEGAPNPATSLFLHTSSG